MKTGHGGLMPHNLRILHIRRVLPQVEPWRHPRPLIKSIHSIGHLSGCASLHMEGGGWPVPIAHHGLWNILESALYLRSLILPLLDKGTGLVDGTAPLDLPVGILPVAKGGPLILRPWVLFDALIQSFRKLIKFSRLLNDFVDLPLFYVG
jgi:hypothetical protein